MILITRHYMQLLAGIGLVILSYFFYLKPAMNERARFIEDEQRIQSELDVVRLGIERLGHAANVVVSDKYRDEKGGLMSELIMLAEMQGLQVKKAMHLNSDNRVQITLLGTYSQSLALMGALSGQKISIYVEDFSIKTVRNSLLEMTLDVIIVLPGSSALIVRDFAAEIHQENPFCHQDSAQVPVYISSNKHYVDDYSIRQVRMLGYSEIKDKVFALIAFPNTRQETVRVGEYIGSERVLITAITRTYLEFQLPDKHVEKLQYSGV